MRKPLFLAVISLLVVAGMLLGCGPAPTPETIIQKETVVHVEVKEVTPTPGPAAPTEITLVDTNSGANFQLFWQSTVIPSVQEQLGIKINYVVSADAEVAERMKAWEEGKGDIHMLFMKPEGLAGLIGAGIPLVKLWPDATAEIPNLNKCPEAYLETAQGVDIQGTGALYWRSQYTLIYNTEYVTDPPTSWQEFYDRRAEWKGHIGWMRPDSKSGSGRGLPYAFVNAFCPLAPDGKAIPLAELEAKPEYQDAIAKLKDFMSHARIANEPTNMFEDFNAGDTWISVYAMDYSLWSVSQGTMPPTIAAGSLSDGMPAGSDGYLAIPANIPEEYKPVVMKVINYLLSDDQQIRLITEMWQYTGTDIEDKIPDVVWRKIPKWAEVEKVRVRQDNKEFTDWIKEHGAEVLLP
jgi:putative spermidine/putrescine transport system substrate-binding protein